MVHNFLILPGSLAYHLAIQELPPPPDWEAKAHKSGGEMALIAPLGTDGLLEAVSLDRAQEYIHDGELDQRMDEIEDLEELEPPLLWLPGDH